MTDFVVDRLTTIPFGSRAWGGWTEDSDWDYVAAARHIEIVRTLLSIYEMEDVTWAVYDGNILGNVASVKYTQGGKVFNLVFYADRKLPILHRLNEYMSEIGEESLQKKIVRCALVENFLMRNQT